MQTPINILALLEAFGKFRNTPPRVNDDARAGPADCGREVKSQY